MNKIAIIGGGIGGLTIANCFHKNNIEFHLFEQAPQLSEVGAGIGLSKSVMELLDKIDLAEELISNGSFIKYASITDKYLKVRRDLPVELDSICIHRAKLIDILKSNLPSHLITLNKKVIRINQKKQKTVINFEDGSSDEFDIVVVADGIHSTIRKQLFPGIQIRYSNQIIFRGITDIEIPNKYQNRFVEAWDDKKRFLFVPLGQNRIFWLAVIKGKPNSEKKTLKDVLFDFDSFSPFAKKLISESSNLIQNDLADLGGFYRSWFKDNVVFLGDSIHATTPNLAQGGCQAIEDAFALSKTLIDSNFESKTAFKHYQKIRNKKAMHVVNTSWKIGRMAHADSNILYFINKLSWNLIPNRYFKKNENFLNDISYLN